MLSARMLRRRLLSNSHPAPIVLRHLHADSKEKLFDKILVANRGEIAVRVMRTCKKLGIKTVAVYSEPDVNSVAVRMADEAYCVGPAPSSQSYLSIPKIIEVVRATGAQAVHPGYGFLSENKDFCEALEAIDVAFIGPGHAAIQAMGDKIESKQLAMDAGVNTIPGFLGEIDTPEKAVNVAQEIGYPVMIKASAGGGGKGMRVAYNDDEVRMGYRLSKEEAASSFGDDRMFVEKFIEDPRHIEIQLIADSHGNVVALPERECSIQRRNQKVIEEAPSVLLDPETRVAMGKQAAMLARKVGYKSAGTVEFLCDKHKNFYFLEMNTRLQVEHPVTELISGIDLVEQMIRVAAGHELPEKLVDKPVEIHGWAMESRVYAEDPLRGFLPSIGRLLQYKEPLYLPGVRVDSGVNEGSDISMFYDPMISKLITYGKDRSECLERMKMALDNYVIRGPGNNISFLQDVYRHPRFVSGKITTKFIDEEYPDGFQGVKLTDPEIEDLRVVGAIMHLKKARAASQISGRIQSTPVERFEVFDLLNKDELEFVSEQAGSVPRLRAIASSVSFENIIDIAERNNLQSLGAQLSVSIDGPFGESKPVVVIEVEFENQYHRTAIATLAFLNKWHVVSNVDWSLNSPLFKASFANQHGLVERPLASQMMQSLPEGFRLQFHGAIHDVIVRNELEVAYGQYMQPKPEVDTSNLLLCPMPGMLISVAVEVGQHVELGQELAIVEAMKMQNVLRSEKRGVIKKIARAAGDTLKVDEIILEYE
ncbi:propionyl-carboxylase alpha mitochondrial [Plasmopara halstedii]|uniref:Propionyl-CoA carboxylase alpha chain, mitochondrial n=1 Tax=Plasmopara halstedii TaxID=4781 RepID=A0A0P1AEX4_PLAHL|nr:propionyl-carboxylase alpha mitochondrial [Plasmopara halstedii]CEG38943.1 propionyl-carboxylase alpha mitochondrial [Plasmopara halstedii]|eukprot:XP_024575312.1 propionyl-carboxylase alpha mitochondrial [Plasmopara halstedii]